jgi:hypothetical protein
MNGILVGVLERDAMIFSAGVRELVGGQNRNSGRSASTAVLSLRRLLNGEPQARIGDDQRHD